MNTINFSVPNISCNHCVQTIQSEVGQVEGVASVSASEKLRQVKIVFEEPASEERIKALLAEINYPVDE